MTSYRVARALTVLSALGLVALWFRLGVAGATVSGSSGASLPDAALPPILLGVAVFSTLALAAAAAAVRDAPLVTLLCGGISLIPVGLYTLLMPFPFPLIGILDVLIVVAGAVLLRSVPRRDPG